MSGDNTSIIDLDIGNGQMLGCRETQQDYFATFSTDEYSILILADGIGGLEHGELASQVVVMAMKDYLSRRDLSDPIRALKMGLDHANHVVASMNQQHASSQGMGSTLVVLMIGYEHIHWMSVGDSLLYRSRSGSLSRLNTPHTRLLDLQKQVSSGSITQSDADNDPQRNSITSAVTGDVIPIVDCKSESRWQSDGFVLASDGLLGVRHAALHSSMACGGDAQSVVDSILNDVIRLEDDYQDNCTVLLVRPKTADPSQAQNHRLLLVAAVALLLFCIPVIYWYLWHPFGPNQRAATNAEVVVSKWQRFSHLDGTVTEEGASERESPILKNMSKDNDHVVHTGF